MKILQLNTEKTWRGGEKQTYYTILGLLQKGIRVGILCRKNSPLFYKAKELQTKFSELKIYTSSGYLRDAYHLEEPFDDRELYALKGDRRLAWIWAEDLSTSYDEKSKEFIIGFYLPKGSYATTFLEEIAKQKLV